MSRPVWAAQVELTRDQAWELIEDQFPELAPVELTPLGEGWDNWAYRVNRDLVFRFPRRRVAVGLLEREAEVLPELAPLLPLPIPSPGYRGRPGRGYPWPFLGYRFLPGRSACGVGLDREGRAALAPALGAFLGALHRAPVSPSRRQEGYPDLFPKTSLGEVLEMRLERLGSVPDEALPVSRGAIEEGFRDLARARPHPGPPVWVHGDLYARHLLVHGGKASGVIDWGDLALSDPALDLSVAWSLLPGEARPAFWRAYRGAGGEADAACRDRARFRALGYGVVLTHYGREIGDRDLVQVGHWALRGALGESTREAGAP